ncbi:MAG: DNA polymerase III subunit beta [Patescibacteria group bacterium]|jgi:DNA polymerase-3 subunit beta
MKLSCTQENLNQAINITSHIAGKNSNLPILANILIKAENNNLTLSATNLEVGVTVNIRSKVENNGEFSIDAKLLNNYISLLPKDRIDLELINEELKVQCQKQKTKIKGQNTSDFPLIPKIEKENPYIISAKKLRDAIYSVFFSAANSELRPELSGVLMDFSDNKLILAATDSYRLAEIKIDYIENNKNSKSNNNEKVIIPAKSLQEISRILSVFKDDDNLEVIENIEIYTNENQIMFVYNGVEFISRLIDGQYPDYNQIIPIECPNKLKVNINELIKAVKTASLFVKNGVFDIKLDYNKSPNELIITSSSSQTGENESVVEMEKIGQGGEIILNYKYLLDGLQVLTSEKAEFSISDPNNPCIIRGEDNNYLYLIMPIRQ